MNKNTGKSKSNVKKVFFWSSWFLLTLALSLYLGFKITVAEDKETLLIGDASHGHFQIELACGTCHTEAFGGGEIIQEACEGCHQEELKAAHDSHPKKKFTDPRNADTLEIIDARYCVSCHTEHQKEQTRDMGVTLPDDYCFHCHQEVGEERESHKDLPFDSCATSGCHNYHDNRALYEGFLVEHAEGSWLNSKLQEIITSESPVIESSVAPSVHDSHQENGIACATCHLGNNESDPNWLPEAQVNTCSQCHSQQAESYQQGKHGMRLAQSLSAINPSESELDFRPESLGLTHSCSSCHQVHEPNPEHSAVGACLSCHSDEHSLAYENSPHGQLWQKKDLLGLQEDQVVTCASCHMPKLKVEGKDSESWLTQHNQNDNLRPNEKMIRPVCMDCHSLAFSIDSLADESLINNNFNGQPSIHVPSIDWALDRDKR